MCRMIVDNLGLFNIGKVLPKFIRNFRDSYISSAKNKFPMISLYMNEILISLMGVLHIFLFKFASLFSLV